MKDLKLDDIKKVRFETGYYSIAPGSFNEIFYSNNKCDLINCYNYTFSKVMLVETDVFQVPGGWHKNITFYDQLNSYNLEISNGFVYGKDFAYHIEKIPGSTKVNNPYVSAYSFVTYGKDDCNIYKVGKENEVVKVINYFDKIEFTEWGNEPMDNSEPKFYIDDWSKVNSKLYIYEPNRFKYCDKFYKVIGDLNFSSLF